MAPHSSTLAWKIPSLLITRKVFLTTRRERGNLSAKFRKANLNHLPKKFFTGASVVNSSPKFIFAEVKINGDCR